MSEVKPFKAACKKTVMIETDKGESLAFMEGEEYSSTNPDPWEAPDPSINVCLIDHRGDNHYMDWEWFHEYFERIKD